MLIPSPWTQSVSRLEAHGVESVLALMKEHGIGPDEKTFDIIIKRHVLGGNFEHALQALFELDDRSLKATLQSAESVIKLACEFRYPRLALDVAEAFEASSVRRLDSTAWMDILIASSHMLWVRLF